MKNFSRSLQYFLFLLNGFSTLASITSKLFYPHKSAFIQKLNVYSPRLHGSCMTMSYDIPIVLVYPSTIKSLPYGELFRKHFPITESIDTKFTSGNILYMIHENSVHSNDVDHLKTVDSIFFIHEDCCTNEFITRNLIRNACKYDFYIPNPTSSPYQHLTIEEFQMKLLRRFTRLIQTIRKDTSSKNNNLNMDLGEWSHFLSLTYPSIDDALPNISILRQGIDAFELRVDLLLDSSVLSIHRQVSLLRDFCSLPIVYTVRTKGQLGKFPLEPSTPIINLLEQGLRAYVEYLDVEACLPSSDIEQISNLALEKYRHRSKLLGSLHVTIPQTAQQITNLLDQTNLNNHADILKVVTGASNDSDCDILHSICSKNKYQKPYIGLSLGVSGQRSRVFNRKFTPVTHRLMSIAAPGQLSVEELMNERQRLGLITSKHFYLFGIPIKQSMSPFMHNTAYKTLLLPHRYDLYESDNVEIYKNVIESNDFGGASVTIPHKETIIPMLDEIFGAAQSIGAVNTIVVVDDNNSNSNSHGNKRRKIGYNTDWIGMLRPIERLLQQNPNRKNTISGKKGYGIVIGAGGTAKAACYAIKQLDLDLIICNRTPEKAQDIAERFGGISMKLEDVISSSRIEIDDIVVIISTIPAQAEITVPTSLLLSKPIVLDVVYKPPRTKLLEQAIGNGCPIVQGATMLFEQGVEQFELWNRRRAPRDEMEAAVFQGIERL